MILVLKLAADLCTIGTLTNALKSFTAAFSLLRGGWRLQPFQCIRNGYEAMSVALHLFSRPEDLAKLKSDELKSTSTVKSLNKLAPMLGHLWSDLSAQFVHVGRPFRHVQKGNTFAPEETDLWHCLAHLAFMAWFMYQAVELVFFASAEKHHFWEQKQPGVYSLNPSSDMEATRKGMIQAYKRFLPASNDH